MKRRNFEKIQREKEHQRGKFGNPYFKHRKIKKAKRARLLLVALLIIPIATPIVLIASPLFHIDQAEIIGLTTIPEPEIHGLIDAQLNKKRFGIFSQRNKLFFNKPELVQKLEDDYQFSQLSLDVKQKTVLLSVEEKISEVVWVSGDSMYVLDLDGVVVRSLYDVERAQIHERLGLPVIEVTQDLPIIMAPTIPIIFDDSQTEVLPGTNPINPIVVQNVIDFDKGVRRLLIHPKTYGVESPATAWMRVDTDMNYDLLFDGTTDIRAQIETLKSVLQENESLTVAEYIDLRFGNRVFVR